MSYAITDTIFVGELPLERRLQAYDTCEVQYPEMKSDWDRLRRNAIQARIDKLEIQWDLFDGSYAGSAEIGLEIGTLRAKLERLK